MGIFSVNAPRLWAAGLPVIPLRQREKAPAIDRWSRFATQMPSSEEQSAWLAEFANGNIGLPLGPQSGIVAVDVDTDDPAVLDIIERLLPKSPWKRRGKKGAVWAYRYTGERTFRVREADGGSVLELLSKGTQVVLPPSIHPETQSAYTAPCGIEEVCAALPTLPADIEAQLRNALVEAGYLLSTRGYTKVTEYVAAGARDNQMVAHAGILSRAVMRGERKLSEALAEITQWCADYVEKVAGDPIDADKGRQKVIEFMIRDATTPSPRPLPKGWDEGLEADTKQLIVDILGGGDEAEMTEWSYKDFVAFMEKEFGQYPIDSDEFSAAVVKVVERIAKSSKLNSLDTDRVINYVYNASGKTITITSMRRQIMEIRRGEIQGTNHTEIAEALIRKLNDYGEIRYFASRWWQWNGAHWQNLSEGLILKMIAEEFGSYDAAKRHGDHRGILKTAENLCFGELCTSSVEGINFANGYLTSDLKLLQHSPEFGKSYILPYRYDPSMAGACPRFFSLLHDSWGADEDADDKIQALREAIALTLFQMGWQFGKAICLIGLPRSGKSTIKNIVSGLTPEGSSCSVPPTEWGDRFSPAQMYGKLMNVCGELSEDKMIPGDLFKSIVEGEEINGQHKGQQIFHFQPKCTHWFATNHPPKTRDSSSGFNSRWLFLRFDHARPEKERVLDLASEILAEEREAIVSWAAEILPTLLRRQAYTLPASHHAELSSIANANNTVRAFLHECSEIRRSDGLQVAETQLHESYYGWTLTVARQKPVSLKTFNMRMKELAPELGLNLRVKSFGSLDQVFYEGVGLVKT